MSPMVLSLHAGIVERILDTLDAVWACQEGLSDEQLRWHPPVPGANNLISIVKHVLGATRETIGLLSHQPNHRQREKEFSAHETKEEFHAQWTQVWRAIKQELQGLPSTAMAGTYVHPRKQFIHPHEETIGGLSLLLNAYAHAQEHLGEARLIRLLLSHRALPTAETSAWERKER